MIPPMILQKKLKVPDQYKAGHIEHDILGQLKYIGKYILPARPLPFLLIPDTSPTITETLYQFMLYEKPL